MVCHFVRLQILNILKPAARKWTWFRYLLRSWDPTIVPVKAAVQLVLEAVKTKDSWAVAKIFVHTEAH